MAKNDYRNRSDAAAFAPPPTRPVAGQGRSAAGPSPAPAPVLPPQAQVITLPVPASHRMLPPAPGRFMLAEHARQVHHAILPAGVPYENIFSDGYFVNFANAIKRGDEIIVKNDEGTLYALVLVRDVTAKSTRLQELYSFRFDAGVKPVEIPGYSVQWKGEFHKFAVIRESDKEIMPTMSGFAVEIDAWNALRQYARTLGLV